MSEEQKNKDIRQEVRERTMGYLIAAFGFVAGLAWNDAIRAFIEYLFPISRNTLTAKFTYAILVTFIVVVLTSYMVRVFNRDKQQ